MRTYGTTAMDYANAISAANQGGAWIAGITEGDLGGTNAGGLDAFVARLDADGNRTWTTQFGTGGSEWATGVTSDEAGTAYVSGFTDGSLAGPSGGQGDAFVAGIGNDGILDWSHQIGTSSNEIAKAVGAGSDGSIVIAGQTAGSLDGASAGGFDAFVARYQ